MIIMVACYDRNPEEWLKWACGTFSFVAMVCMGINYVFCKSKKLDENPRSLAMKVQTLWPYAMNKVLPYRVSTFFYAVIMVQSFFAGLILVSTAHLVMAYCEGRMHEMAAERINMNEIRRQVFERIKTALTEPVSQNETDPVKIEKQNKIGYLHHDEKPPK
jgi:hypothetical protein